jgi:MoaA/NifB/PqqE/SkfB family radical SAM enzyme
MKPLKECKESNHREKVRAGITNGMLAFTGPEHVVIDLTNRCYNSCIACWTRSPLLDSNTPEKDWHKKELKIERVLNLIDELHNLGTSIIRFTGGGEPLLHKDIFKLIQAVKARGIYCAVTTGFNMASRKIAAKLIYCGLDELAISLWASNPMEYVRTHPNQTEQTFNRITETLRRLKNIKQIRRITSVSGWSKPATPRVNILNVICNLNYKSIEAMYDYALSVGADSIYYTLVDSIEGSTDTLLLSDKQRREVYAKCLVIEKRNNALSSRRRLYLDNFEGLKKRLLQDEADKGYYDQRAVHETPCYIGWIFCRIMADGQVAPCCRGVQIPMGNINQSAFAEIWHSKKYNTFRYKAKNRNKNDRFFSKVGCHKTCDNYMHNQDIHNWLLSEGE